MAFNRWCQAAARRPQAAARPSSRPRPSGTARPSGGSCRGCPGTRRRPSTPWGRPWPRSRSSIASSGRCVGGPGCTATGVEHPTAIGVASGWGVVGVHSQVAYDGADPRPLSRASQAERERAELSGELDGAQGELAAARDRVAQLEGAMVRGGVGHGGGGERPARTSRCPPRPLAAASATRTRGGPPGSPHAGGSTDDPGDSGGSSNASPEPPDADTPAHQAPARGARRAPSCAPSSTSPTRTPTRGTRDPLVTRAPGTRAPPGTRARGGGWTERRPASARGGSARTPRPSLPRGTTRAGARGARRIPPAPLGPLGARGRGRRAAADPVGAGAPGGMPGPAGPVGTSAPGRARPRARGVPRPPRRVVRPRISAVGVAAPALGRVARRGSAETVRDFGGCPSPRGRCAGTPQTRSRDPGWGNI